MTVILLSSLLLSVSEADVEALGLACGVQTLLGHFFVCELGRSQSHCMPVPPALKGGGVIILPDGTVVRVRGVN